MSALAELKRRNMTRSEGLPQSEAGTGGKLQVKR
jgi:hypothetical protein